MTSHFVLTALPHNSHQHSPFILTKLCDRGLRQQFSCLKHVVSLQLFNILIGHSLRGANNDKRTVLFSCNGFSVGHFTFPCALSSHLASNLLAGGGLTQLIFRSRLTKWILTPGQPLPSLGKFSILNKVSSNSTA